MGTSFFSQGTAVERTGDARYSAYLADAWNCPIVPHGGIVTTTAVRAMSAELGDAGQQLRSVHSVFAGQVHHGPVEIEVEVLRRGRSMSQCVATLRNPGDAAGLTALAVFGAEREGFTFTDRALPADVNPVESCPSFRDDPPDDVDFEFTGTPPAFWQHVEGRPSLGHAPWEDYDPTSSLRCAWYRFDDPPRDDDGAWDPLAALTLCDTMPGAVGERIGPQGRDRWWWAPSADLTVHMLGEARSDWVLMVNRAHKAAEGYASADVELWDVDGEAPTLVAYGTQMMFFTFRQM